MADDRRPMGPEEEAHEFGLEAALLSEADFGAQ